MTCDSSYDPEDETAVAVHLHPEPQSGLFREDWLESKLSYKMWITKTEKGKHWQLIQNDNIAKQAFWEEQNKILTDVPREFRDFLSQFAWEQGHASGYNEVIAILKDLVFEFGIALKQYQDKEPHKSGNDD